MQNSSTGRKIGYVVEALVERSAHRFWIRLAFVTTHQNALELVAAGMPVDAVESRVLPYYRVPREQVAAASLYAAVPQTASERLAPQAIERGGRRNHVGIGAASTVGA